MISLLLMEKISQLFLILLLGFFSVKAGLLKAEDTTVLSRVCLYIITPCVIIKCFQVDFTEDVRNGLILAFIAGFVSQMMILAVCKGAKKLFHLDTVEHASSIYSNSANLIIPVIAAVLGPEWIVYTTGYSTTQIVLFWTHLINLFSKEGIQLKKVLSNVNIICTIIGGIMLVVGIRLPAVANNALDMAGNMIGPMSMLIVGMLMSKISLRDLFLNKRIYLVLFIRMFLCPTMMLLLLKLTNVGALVNNGHQILMISLLATAAPTANTVTQFAQLYDERPSYASAISTLTTLSCILTMPLFVYLYQIL